MPYPHNDWHYKHVLESHDQNTRSTCQEVIRQRLEQHETPFNTCKNRPYPHNDWHYKHVLEPHDQNTRSMCQEVIRQRLDQHETPFNTCRNRPYPHNDWHYKHVLEARARMGKPILARHNNTCWKHVHGWESQEKRTTNQEQDEHVPRNKA